MAKVGTLPERHQSSPGRPRGLIGAAATFHVTNGFRGSAERGGRALRLSLLQPFGCWENHTLPCRKAHQFVDRPDQAFDLPHAHLGLVGGHVWGVPVWEFARGRKDDSGLPAAPSSSLTR